MPVPVLEFNHVSRSYRKGVPVLRDVTFEVGAAEVVGVLGRNGTGKTTLIRIAMGLLNAHSGSVRVFGLDPVEDPVEVKRRIGYVAEDQVFPPGSSIDELMRFHQYLFPSWDTSLENEMIDRFGLPKKLSMVRLSKGQARQVALICAIAHRPELLILDEPAGGLDPAARREFLEASLQLLHKEGSSILFSSHHMSDVERIGARVVLLESGTVRMDDSLANLRDAVCVAVVAKSDSLDAFALERLPGCLRVRSLDENWHAVFRGGAEDVSRSLKESLDGAEFQCSRVDLEELFIELLGEKR